jgi:hypothetical protein
VSDWTTLVLGYSGAVLALGGYAAWLLQRSAKVGRQLRLGDLGDRQDPGSGDPGAGGFPVRDGHGRT